MTSPVDEIKNRIDIVDLIQGYINLQKAGRNFKANCPFHSEKTPSFMVSRERQLWRCFGCDKGGSIFDFIMEIEGVEFADALRILAQRAGIELKKIDPKLKTERTRLYEICDLAAQFFAKQLEASQTGKKIKEYLSGRGLKQKTISDWRVGYAPESWQGLMDFLNSRGYSDQEILKSGLSIKAEKPGKRAYYDRFRDRIIFPIKNLNGIIVGFSGRENPNQPDSRMGKYINTPNTLIYDKSKILYGLDKAKLDIRKKDLCVLVEGQMDILMSHQAGFKNAVASSGIALTEDQLRIIKRYTDNLATAFDMDQAGEIATKRGANLALQNGLNAKVISLSDGQDPADCLQKDPSLWGQAIDNAQGLIEFYLDNAFSKNDPETAQGKREISKVLLPLVKKVPNRVEQAHWLQEIARRLKVGEDVLIEEMRNQNTDDIQTRVVKKELSQSQTSNMPDLEEYVLGLVLSYPKVLEKCQKEPCYLFVNSDLEQIFKALKDVKTKKINLVSLKKKLQPHLADRIDYLVFRTEVQKNLVNDFKPDKEIRLCFDQLKNRHLRQKLNQLNLAIQEAENKKDKFSLQKLTKEFNKLSKQMII